jgi:hypothetical protein
VAKSRYVVGPAVLPEPGSKVVVAGGTAVIALAPLLLTQATVNSGYVLVGIVVAMLGTGRGTATAPATKSIMGSLPLAKTGVGLVRAWLDPLPNGVLWPPSG